MRSHGRFDQAGSGDDGSGSGGRGIRRVKMLAGGWRAAFWASEGDGQRVGE